MTTKDYRPEESADETVFVYPANDGGEIPADEAFLEEDVVAPG